jgi:hypothetical protein
MVQQRRTREPSAPPHTRRSCSSVAASLRRSLTEPLLRGRGGALPASR